MFHLSLVENLNQVITICYLFVCTTLWFSAIIGFSKVQSSRLQNARINLKLLFRVLDHNAIIILHPKQYFGATGRQTK